MSESLDGHISNERDRRLVGGLWPLLSITYEFLEEAAQKAADYIADTDGVYDPWFFCHIVRYHVCNAIDDLKDTDLTCSREPLPMSGIEVSFRGKTIKFFRSNDGELPPPGRSRRKHEFYAANLFGALEDFFDARNWVVTWEADRTGGIVEVTLVLPVPGASDHSPGRAVLAIAVPHPADVQKPVLVYAAADEPLDGQETDTMSDESVKERRNQGELE